MQSNAHFASDAIKNDYISTDAASHLVVKIRKKEQYVSKRNFTDVPFNMLQSYLCFEENN